MCIDEEKRDEKVEGRGPDGGVRSEECLSLAGAAQDQSRPQEADVVFGQAVCYRGLEDAGGGCSANHINRLGGRNAGRLYCSSATGSRGIIAQQHQIRVHELCMESLSTLIAS